MSKKKDKPTPSVTHAAEFLWAIFDEFRAKSETAGLHMRRARVLLDMTIDQAIKAVEANVVALQQKKGRR